MTLPIFLAHQFVKHQVGGVRSEESRRYISDEPEDCGFGWWHALAEGIKQGSDGLIEYQDEARGYTERRGEFGVGKVHPPARFESGEEAHRCCPSTP